MSLIEWLNLGVRAASALPALIAVMKKAETSITSNEEVIAKVKDLLNDFEQGIKEIEAVID